MSKQDELQYAQQEKRIQAQSDAFITLLAKQGILGDSRIDVHKGVLPDRKRRLLSQHADASPALSHAGVDAGIFPEAVCHRRA